MALANIGAPVGSEVILPAAGALAATGHLSNIWIALGVAIAAELFGQSVAYAVGRFGGRPFVDRFGRYVRFHHEQLERVDDFFARYGSFAIFLCRFIPVVRGIAGIPAGIARMPLPAFYLWTFLGSLVFCAGLMFAGFGLGEHSGAAGELFRRFALPVVAVVLLAVVAYAIVRRRKGSSTVY